jgi:PAS domain S-box-containing protein
MSRHGLGGRFVRSAGGLGASGASGADERLKRFLAFAGKLAAHARGRLRPLAAVRRSVGAFALDPTERKRAEQALRASEAKVRRLVDSNIMGVFEFKVEWKTNEANEVSLTEANDAFLEMVGYDREDLAAGRLHWAQLTPPEWRAATERALAELTATGTVPPYEKEYFRKDGSRAPVLVGAATFEEPRNQGVAFVLDLTERKRAEQELRASENRFRTFVDHATDAFMLHREDGTVLEVNREACESLGYARDELIGMAVTDFDPDGNEALLQSIRERLAAGEIATFESRHRRKDGTVFPVEVRLREFRQDGGRFAISLTRDITERKRAESLLAGEKRILEMVAKGEQLARILESLCRLVEEQASGVLASILLLDGDRLRHGGAPSLPKAYTDAIDGALIGPSAGSCGTAAYRREQVIVEDIATDPLWTGYRDAALPHSLRACWSTPIFSSQAEVIATFAMYYPEPRSPGPRDQDTIEQITHLAGIAIERNRIQEALRRSEAHLMEAQRLTKTGSWAYDPSTGKSTYWSDENFRIFGLDPQEGPSSEIFWRHLHPEDRDRVRERFGREAHAKREYVDDYRIVLADGTVKHIHDIGHPVFDAEGKLVEFVGTTVDVTERKRSEEALHEIQTELAHANRVATMGQLTASIAHEVNQPIAAAVTNANAALRWLSVERPDLEEARRALGRIVDNGNRAGEVIGRIRALIKKAPPQKDSVAIKDAILDVVALTHGEAVKHRVLVRTRLAEGLPPVEGDRVQLQQVILNLVVNAFEAMSGQHEARELLISAEKAEPDGVLVAVGDSGPGLAPEHLERLFEAFYTTKPTGMGMGLSICRSIIEAHGGRLWASANEPRGAVFQFTAPAYAGVAS